MTRTRRTATTLAAAIQHSRTTARQFKTAGAPEDAAAAAEAALTLAQAAEAQLNSPAGLLRNLLVRAASHHRPRPPRLPFTDRGIQPFSEPEELRHSRAEIGLTALVIATWLGTRTGPTRPTVGPLDDTTVPMLAKILRISTSREEEDRLEFTHLLGDLIADLVHLAHQAGTDLHAAIAYALPHFQTEHDDH